MTASPHAPISRHPAEPAATRRAALRQGRPSRWLTPEGIPVKPAYGEADLAGSTSSTPIPGIAPFLRGPYPTMYVNQPWTIRQYAGFSTAEDSNAFYRRNLAAGQKGLSVAFDLATHRGYDSDHPRVSRRRRHGRRRDRLDLRHAHAVRRHPARPDGGVDDHERRGAADPGALHRRGRGAGRAARASSPGTIQNDILKEFMVRNTYIYPPDALDADHLRHLRLHLAEDAEVQLDLDLRLPHAGGRGDGRPRARLHAGRRRRVPPRRHRGRASTSTRSRRGCRSSGRSA